MAQPPALQSSVLDALGAAGVTTTLTSLELPDDIDFDAYWVVASCLGMIGKAYPWWVGDLMNEGEKIFGEEFAQVEKALPHSPETLSNYKSVSNHIPRTRRRKALSFSVHQEVAYLEPRERDAWLDKAELYDWKRQEMRDARRIAREEQTVGSVGQVAVTSKNDRLGHEGLDREEGPAGVVDGIPAPAIGELVLGRTVCPTCHRPLDDDVGGG